MRETRVEGGFSAGEDGIDAACNQNTVHPKPLV